MRAAPDHIQETISFGLYEISAVTRVHDGWRVTTQVMYPSNGLVQVTVRGGVQTIVASDEGGGVGEARSAGIAVRETDNTLARIVRDQGLLLKEGVIYTPQVPLEAAPVAILHVANASQEVARWLYEHTKIRRTRDFKAMLAAFLRRSPRRRRAACGSAASGSVCS